MKILQLKRRAPTFPWYVTFFGWVIIQRIIQVFIMIVYRAKFLGRSNIHSQGAIIYVSNHQSNYDPILISCLIRDRPFSSMARAGLFDFKPFGWLIRLFGTISLKRGQQDIAAMRAALEVLSRGGCILLFPEGARTPDGTIHPFKRGFLVLVKKSKAPVVPIAVEGNHDIYPIGQTYPKFRGRMMVKAGKPIPAEELLAKQSDQALEDLRKEIDAMRLELREELRNVTRGKFPKPGLADASCSREAIIAKT